MKIRRLPFSEKLRSFSNTAARAAFPLGGIGTGNVSVGARGELRDWEILNGPNKGMKLPYAFFAVHMRQPGKDPVSRVLEARLNPPFDAADGLKSEDVAGLPRFAHSELTGEYPFVRVALSDPEVPLDVTLEAFTPFIPLNADDSGIPGAVLRSRVKNRSALPAGVTVTGSLPNVSAYGGTDYWGRFQTAGEVENEYREQDGLKGIFFRPCEPIGDRLNYGDMTLATTHAGTTARVHWLETGWYDGIEDFWRDFTDDGRLEAEPDRPAAGSAIAVRAQKVGSVGAVGQIGPGEEGTFEFILTWYFPNRPNGWSHENVAPGAVKNYYSRLFGSSWEAAAYLRANMERLEGDTVKFHDALYGSTLPACVLDAVGSNLAALRSCTCFRTADGNFYWWEGCLDHEGSCYGNCTHVWNYAQTVAYLFPELEKTMCRVAFLVETGEDGRMAFRTQQTFGLPKWEMLPAADGQPGMMLRLYRYWKLTGDDAFVREVWKKAAASLDFGFSWDTDGDGLPDGKQHNTYDIEIYGPNPLTAIMFCAALKAGAELAELVGDGAHASKFLAASRKGLANIDGQLWNGEYYEQKLDDPDAYRYQYGKGCLSDQLLGQLLARMAGLGRLLPEEHVRKAVHAIYRYNFREDFRRHENVQRTYALDDEKGLVLCSWPKGGRPRIPFVYSDEVWTGVEYQVASHLICEGFAEEGVRMVQAVRGRYDGIRRNPWDEIECGHHYARSMASWGLLPATSGFRCDMAAGTISFSPQWSPKNFAAFWSTGKAWEIFRRTTDAQGKTQRRLEVLYGDADAVRLV